MGVPLNKTPGNTGMITSGQSSAVKQKQFWAALGGIAPIIGSGIDYLTGKSQQKFQERMSNSSYQRAVRDMRKAGINPIMAFQQGGASTPSGSSSQPGKGVAESISSAHRVRLERRADQRETNLYEKQIELMDAQRDAATNSAKKIWEEAETERGSRLGVTNLLNSQKDAADASARDSSASAALKELGVSGARNEAALQEGLNRLMKGGNFSWEDVKRLGLGAGGALLQKVKPR